MADEDRTELTEQLRQMKNRKLKSKAPRRKPGNLLKIGNKEKGHAFVEKRKKIALKEYKKLIKKTREEHRMKAASDNTDPGRNSETISSNQEKFNWWQSSESCRQGVRKRNHLTKQKPVNRFTAAESEFKKRKFEKERQIKEREAIIQKHREEVQEKMKKRRETFGRLSRRTRKGQPIMANQIEHLLGKIQSQS